MMENMCGARYDFENILLFRGKLILFKLCCMKNNLNMYKGYKLNLYLKILFSSF